MVDDGQSGRLRFDGLPRLGHHADRDGRHVLSEETQQGPWFLE